MSGEMLSQAATLIGLTVAVVGLTARWRETRRRAAPVDRAPAKGDPARGVRYAFTVGMAPWTKESTRLHALAYLRGVGFHLAIFAGAAVLLGRPVWPMLPPWLRAAAAGALGLGALLGAAGSVMRLREPHLRALSTVDDHVSIWLVTASLAMTGLALWEAQFIVPMYVAAALMLAYIPLGKIRHCLYFFLAKGYFGRFGGRRGVLPPRGPSGQPASFVREGAR
ncbi:MAG: hypothetical protein QN178_05305 [Armatimonadota bacterium]|nr:hypothetical protein [Armatimonadota bacterium]